MSQQISRAQAVKEFWYRGNLSWKLHSVQKEMYKIFYSSEKNSTLVWLLSRQTGKCLAEGTLVATPNGPVKIEDLKPGDTVYGYNKDGSVSPTKVVAVQDQGKKEVCDLINHGVTWATATPEHRWGGFNTFTKKFEELTTAEFFQSPHKKIVRCHVNTPMGIVNEPHAYALGAFLGDGCSRQKGNQLWISSEDHIIPNRIASLLDCKVFANSEFNYNWSFKEKDTQFYKHTKKINVNHYNEWCRGRYAHEKIIDLDVIKTWNRESCLNLLAGLLDTDGSVFITGRDNNELKLSLGMQAKSVVDAFEYLFLALWQIPLSRMIDQRKKYKNGPIYIAYSNNNFHVKKALKELSPYLSLERKKYKPEYDLFKDHNMKEGRLGIKKGATYIAQTYDIQVDNETNLYLLANGLVTHNSTLLSILAIEQSLKKKNSVVKLLTDTKVHAKMIFEPIFKDILDTCPDELKPRYSEKDYAYYFNNGSVIQLAGSDNGHYERLRGQKSELVLVDEAGFCDNLDYVISSVLFPTTTHTGGRIVLASTPSPDSDHDFIKFTEKAELDGLLTKKTIYDNPLLSKEQVERIVKEMGGVSSVKFRREYLCVDENTWVKTKEGYKAIKDIIPGDLVFTHKGRYKPVLNKFLNPLGSRKVYKVNSSNNEGVICTEGHELFIATSKYKSLHSGHKEEWKKVEDIDLTHPTKRVYFKVPVDTELSVGDYSEDLAYLVGWHLAEGHCGKNYSTLSLNYKDRIDLINEKSLKVWGKEYVPYNKQKNCVQYQLNLKTASDFYKQFGSNAKDKFIPYNLKTASQEIKVALLQGLFSGDGYYNIEKKTAGLCSISKNLISDASDILNSLQIPHQISKFREEGQSVILNRNVYVQDCYRITINGENFDNFLKTIHKMETINKSSRSRSIIKDGFLYSRIHRIEQIQYNKPIVYDIEVEEDHSYVGLHATFHNCEQIKDESLSVLPEFDEILEQDIVKEWPRPPFFDAYVSMDLGGRDLTVALFAYYDFRADKVIVEDELVMDFNKSENTIQKLTEEILKKESNVFLDVITGEVRKPYIRVSDINYIVTQEISKYSNRLLSFSIPRKDDKDAAINNLRAMLSAKKIIIHPRCQTLIRHLRNVKWNKAKTSFARSPDNGHYDATDACIYLTRSISYGKNPYPNHYNLDMRNVYLPSNPKSTGNQTVDVFKKVFKR